MDSDSTVNNPNHPRPYRVLFWRGDKFVKKLYYAPKIPRIGERVSIVVGIGNCIDGRVEDIKYQFLIDSAPANYQTDINIYLIEE